MLYGSYEIVGLQDEQHFARHLVEHLRDLRDQRRRVALDFLLLKSQS